MENIPTNSSTSLLQIMSLFVSLAVCVMHKNNLKPKINSLLEAKNVCSSAILSAKRLGTFMMWRTMSFLQVGTSSSLKVSSRALMFQHRRLLHIHSNLLPNTGIFRNTIPYLLLLSLNRFPLLHQPLFLLLHQT